MPEQFETITQPAVISLCPPKLNPKTILRQLNCIRPMREGCFNISTDKIGAKQIVHCYGHGGAGWTTLFGSVGKAISLLPKEAAPIRVIGSGCIGLTAAIELTRLGYQVAGITTREVYDIPSWRAAGYFAFVSLNTSPEERENLNAMGVETFKTCRLIEAGNHPYISADAVRKLPVYSSKETEAGIEELEALGLIPPHEEVTLDFGSGARHEGFVKYISYFLDTTKMMKQLLAEVATLGIPIEFKGVKSFDEIEEKVIFNCTGIGSRELNHDDKIIPVKGHLVLLNERSGIDHMDYIIYTKVIQDGREEYIYMFPKAMSVSSSNLNGEPCQCALGGTFIPHVDRLTQEQSEELDRIEFQKLLDRNSLFFHNVPFPNQ